MVLKKAKLEESLHMTSDEVRSLRSAERKLAPRLLILIAAFIAVNYIDRTNLALASVELTSALGLKAETYGLGASLFFVSYCVLQVPSQMMMAYVKRQNLWLVGLLITWGTVSAAMAAVRNIPQFLLLRVLLGMFEAGALPALWSYLSHFYCKERLAVPLGVMMGTLILSQAIGPLLAAGLLSMGGLGGLEGWRWLFVVEGCLAIAIAIGWLFMPPSLDSVKALSDDERAAIDTSFAHTAKPAKGGNQLAVLMAAISNPTVAITCVIKFCRDVAFYGVVYWSPMIVKSIMGFDAFAPHGAGASPSHQESIRIVLLVAVPFGAGAIVQFINAWHSQRTNERRFHLAGAWAVGAVALFMLPLAMRSSSAAAAFAVLVVAAMGTFGAEGIMIAHFLALQGGEKGIGIALVNSAGGVGGFVGPLVIGALQQHSGSYESSMLVLGAFLLFASVLVATFNPAWAEKWMLKSAVQQAAGSKGLGIDLVDLEGQKAVEGGEGAAGAKAAMSCEKVLVQAHN